MTTKIKTTIGVSLFMLLTVVVLMSTIVLRPQITRAAYLQSAHDICAGRMQACPYIQINWANFH